MGQTMQNNAPEGDNTPELAGRLPAGIHFVSGIDTDAGKTVCTGWLARELLRAGRLVATMKLVQTGCRDFSPDLRLHRRLMGVTLPEDEEGITAPALFSYPASPHLAAELDGRTLDLDHILSCAKRLAENYEVVLVEGAGGLAVPLTRDLLAIDFAAAQHWPFVFVTSGKLGSVNHTLLSMEAIAHRGGTISAVIYNDVCVNPDPIIGADTGDYLHAEQRKRFPQALWLECPRLSPEEIGQ